MALTVLNLDYPMVVIGVDPGATTGVAVYRVPSADGLPVQLDTAQFGDADTVWQKLRGISERVRADYQPSSVVFAIEQFDKRPGIVDPDYSSMYIIKDINRYMSDETIVWFTPSQAKNLVKPAHRGAPDALKRFGWYKVGMGHANDASRHVIVFLVETLRHMPTIHRGWPKRD